MTKINKDDAILDKHYLVRDSKGYFNVAYPFISETNKQRYWCEIDGEYSYADDKIIEVWELPE